ncbi:MAG: response regulator [Bacteroidota bacterium]|nr:response regulator [Bacteroidota bacterium]
MKLTKQKFPYLKVVFASGVLVSIFILFYSNAKNNTNSTALVEHTQQVIKNSDDLLVSLVNHQTGVRGYLLTNDTSLLEPYYASLPNIKLHFNELSRLTEDDIYQQQRVDTLKNIFDQRFNFSVELIIQNHANNLNNIQKATFAQNGEIITTKIKTLLKEINNTEYKLLEERKVINDRDKQNINLLFIILLAGSFGLLIYSILSFQKNARLNIASQMEKDALERKALNLETEKTIAVEFARQSQITTVLKQQFLANMSHEIRTPMTAIIGFSKVVLKTDLTDKQKEYINAIKTSSDALLILVNDILDLAKVDAGKMTFEENEFEMEVDIRAMLHLFDLKFQEKNLKLVIDYDTKIPKVLIGDSVRLNQIILNLISNAIKFTSTGKITVGIRLTDSSEEKVTIEFVVSDTGIGFDENMIPTLFESFQQANSSTARQYGGTGLGLAIVKQLVEGQSGTISVKSKINEGSTFCFALSFKKTNSKIESESPIPEINVEVEKIKILAVEDTPLNQLLLRIILDEFGFEYDFAENGKVAIEKLQTSSYDIILMDIQMPVMSGIEATEYIRNKMKSTIPIIALTADVTMADLEKCKAVGMNGHISKPIDEKQLHKKIVELAIKR